MKKILFAAATVAMLFATSCKNESVNEPETLREPEANEFLATIDQNANPQNAPSVSGGMSTKAYFNGNNVMWKNGDVITVDGTSTYTCSITSGSQAIFTGAAVKAGTHTAYYGCTANNLPATQTYDPQNNASHLPMYGTCGSDRKLTFKNICGALRIIVPLSTANKIVVTATEDINGTFTIDNSGANPKAVVSNTPSTADNKSITLSRSAGTFQNGDTVYIALPEGTYHGLNIQFMNGTTEEWATGASTSQTGYSVVANQIQDVNMVGAFKGLLPGKFSVSATKKVRFTTGNLYWNGTSCQLESSQDAYPTSWNTSHVGHFFFNDDIVAAACSTYTADNNHLFCDENHKIALNGGSQNVYYDLTVNEWMYCIGNDNYQGEKEYYNPQQAQCTTVHGRQVSNAYFVIVAPDGFTGTIPTYNTIENYTKAGFLCLPESGYRSGTTVKTTDGARYGTATPTSDDKWAILAFRWNCSANLRQFYFGNWGKGTARCIRLVKDI